MAKSKTNSKATKESKAIRPALSLEGRQNQMISLAVDLAEQQLKDGTASSQIIVHYLKLATVEKRLELEKLEKENKLLEAKTNALESGQNIEALYKEAMTAFKTYSGQRDE